ncbi:MAG: hypothetical protein AAGC79_04160 [Pseudomonadota bacterium]
MSNDPTEISDEDLSTATGGVASTAGSNPEGLRRIERRDWGRVSSSASGNPEGVQSTAGTNPEGVQSSASGNPEG